LTLTSTLYRLYEQLTKARKAIQCNSSADEASGAIADALDAIWLHLSGEEHDNLDDAPRQAEIDEQRQVVRELEDRLIHAFSVRDAVQGRRYAMRRCDIATAVYYDAQIAEAERDAVERCQIMRDGLHNACAHLVRLRKDTTT
jgi:hypothetical protein